MRPTSSYIPRICKKCDKKVYRWTNAENFNTCDCGEQLGSVRSSRPDGDPQEFWSLELGMLGEQQKEYKKLHPDAEFNKFGARKVKGYKGAQKILKERGMVELTESREYREHQRDELEKARSTINEK